MISVFTKYDYSNTGLSIDPKLRYIKEKLTKEIDDVKEYYRYRNGKVKNNNMLVRLINTIDPNYHKDIFDYMSYVDRDVRFVSKNFDIVSDIHKGKVLDSVMFGENSQEIFIYKEDMFDLLEVDSTWRELEPIKVIRTDITDTSLVMPSEKYKFFMPTLSIFSIDIRKLLVMYKYWSLERLSNDFSTDPAYFIYGVIYPGMINNIMDIAIFNRLVAIDNDEHIGNNDNQHPFNILNMNNTIDKMLRDTLKDIRYSNKYYTHILKNIHLIGSDMYSILLNDNIGTKQSKWAIWLSNIPYVLFLLNISDKKTLRRNKQTINELLILIKSLERDRVMDTIDDDMVDFMYTLNINLIKETIGER